MQPASARTEIIFSVELTVCDGLNFGASDSEAICGTFSSFATTDLGILLGGANGVTNPVFTGRLREPICLFWGRTIFSARVSDWKIVIEASDNGGKKAPNFYGVFENREGR